MTNGRGAGRKGLASVVGRSNAAHRRGLKSVCMQANGRAKTGSDAGTSGQGAGAAGAPAPSESPVPAQQSKRRRRELRAAARSGAKGTRRVGNAAAQVPSSAVQASPQRMQRRPTEAASSQQAVKQKPIGKQKPLAQQQKRARTDGAFP